MTAMVVNTILSSTLLSAFVGMSWADAKCLDVNVDPKIRPKVQKLANSKLKRGNLKDLPPGLPEGKFPIRSVEIVASIDGHALVFFSFRESIDSKDEPFRAAFAYDGKKNRLTKIEVGDLGNNDSRFWDVKTETAKRCGPPSIKITYDMCSACGDGNDLVGWFDFDEKTASWNFRRSTPINYPESESN